MVKSDFPKNTDKSILKYKLYLKFKFNLNFILYKWSFSCFIKIYRFSIELKSAYEIVAKILSPS